MSVISQRFRALSNFLRRVLTDLSVAITASDLCFGRDEIKVAHEIGENIATRVSRTLRKTPHICCSKPSSRKVQFFSRHFYFILLAI
jgi:hypothetical protein